MKYRTERLWGEGYIDAAEVMAHETFELGNTDIAETLAETILKGTSVGEKLLILTKELEKDEIVEGDNGLLFEIIENYSNSEFYEKLGILFFEEVLEEINRVTNKDIKYCLWLSDSPEDIINEYDMNNELDENSFDAYEESDIILSDLGIGGKLYGYEEEPRPVDFKYDFDR